MQRTCLLDFLWSKHTPGQTRMRVEKREFAWELTGYYRALRKNSYNVIIKIWTSSKSMRVDESWWFNRFFFWQKTGEKNWEITWNLQKQHARRRVLEDQSSSENKTKIFVIRNRNIRNSQPKWPPYFLSSVSTILWNFL
jgi:hypothetical protein